MRFPAVCLSRAFLEQRPGRGEERGTVAALSRGISGKGRQEDGGQERGLGRLPSQSSAPSPAPASGGMEGEGGTGGRGRPEQGGPPPASTTYVLLPNFPSRLCARDPGLHINKTMEFLFLLLINYIIQTLKHL